MSQAPHRHGQTGDRLRWGRRVAWGLFAIGALFVIGVVTAQPRAGVQYQHEYPYRPQMRQSALSVLALIALPVGLALAWTLSRRRELGRREQWVLVAVITIGALLLRLGAAHYPRWFPGAEVGWPFLWKSTEGAYASDVRRVTTVRSFLSGYAGGLAASGTPGHPHRVHLDTHPPGILLGFAAVESFYDARPELAAAVRDWMHRNFPTSQTLTTQRAYALRHPLAVSVTMALGVIVLASLAPLAAYALARQFLCGEAAVVAAGLCALISGTFLFSPSIDQAYPLGTLLLAAVALRAAKRRSIVWGLATGLVLYVAAFVHVAFGLVMVVVALAGLLAWHRTQEPGSRELRRLAAACRRPTAGLLAGFFAPALLLRLWAGYPTLRVVWLCVRNNGRFYAEAGRTYWPWLPITPLEFALSFGVGAAIVFAVAWCIEVRGIVGRRVCSEGSALLLATGAVLGLLYVAGAARGEAARLWLIFMPLAMVAVVDAVWHRLGNPRAVLAAIAAVQLVQTVALAVALDWGHTTTFFWNIMQRG